MDADHSIDVLVIVPVFNAAAHLNELIDRLGTYVCDGNLLFINDGSTDASLDILRRHDKNFISFPDNRGKGAALQTGLAVAQKQGYRSVLTLDADLQHLPEEIPRFFAADNGQRLLLGQRARTKTAMPPARRLSNFLTSAIVSVFSGRPCCDSQCGFRLIPVSLLAHLRLTATGFDLESELLFQAGALGYSVDNIPISTVYGARASAIHHLRDTARFTYHIWRRIWL